MRWPGRTLALPLVAGAVAGLLCWIAYRIPPASTSDFEPLWVAARALRAGQDPYDVVPTMGTRYPTFCPVFSRVSVCTVFERSGCSIVARSVPVLSDS